MTLTHLDENQNPEVPEHPMPDGQCACLATNLTLADAQGVAEDHARAQGAGGLTNPRVKWRQAPASDGQLRHMLDLSILATSGLTKGQSADLIRLPRRHGRCAPERGWHVANLLTGVRQLVVTPVCDAAMTYLKVGLSVLPIAPGKKAPSLINERTGTSFDIKWKARYQERRASAREVRRWFSGKQPMGIGIVCGTISGPCVDGMQYALEVLDFDEEETLASWETLLRGWGHGALLDRLPKTRTPRQGAQFPYLTEVVEGSQKLAQRQEGIDDQGCPIIITLIETRGQGGLVVVAPTPPGIHPKCPERGYVMERGSWLGLPIITAESRARLLECARAFNCYVPGDAYIDRPATRVTHGDDSPGSDYNARVSGVEVLAILERHGWQVAHQQTDVRYLTRPGKDVKDGISASFGKVAPNVLYVFSTNAHPFEGPRGNHPGTPYDPFGVYVRLEHGGDFTAAAKALAAKGYGNHPSPQRGRLHPVRPYTGYCGYQPYRGYGQEVPRG